MVILLSNDFQDLSFCPIVSSIAIYNHNPDQFLSELFNLDIPNEHYTKDSFIFMNKYKG